MSFSIDAIGQALWVLGIVLWYVIRHPFERRARRMKVISNRRSPSDRIALAVAFSGLGIVPAVHVATGFPEVADYPGSAWAVGIGAVVFAGALWLFRRSHQELGRNWSITLEIREKHRLVSGGPYALVRHPMYTSFMLMGFGQAFLLSNWVAGLSGLAGFVVLFFLRVAKEERMMMESFGAEYRAYMERTRRLIPFLY